MQTTYHILIKKDYATAVIEDLERMEAVELLPDSFLQVPQWQIDEIRKRKEYYLNHPEELISWTDAQKMITTE